MLVLFLMSVAIVLVVAVAKKASKLAAIRRLTTKHLMYIVLYAKGEIGLDEVMKIGEKIADEIKSVRLS